MGSGGESWVAEYFELDLGAGAANPVWCQAVLRGRAAS